MRVNDSENDVLSSEQDSINKLMKNMPKLANLFDVHRLSGKGTFSSVYLGTLKNKRGNPKKKFAIKHIIPTSHPNRILFELNCLKLLGGRNNVAELNLCLREENNVAFVMPFHSHQSFYEYVDDMDCKETVHYMYNLLKALAHVHKHGIIHRDIKPSNFLYDRRNKRYLLVDFGLAQLVDENLPNRKRKRESDAEDNSIPDSKRLFTNRNLQTLFDSRTHFTKKSYYKENIPQERNAVVGTKEKSNKSLLHKQTAPTCSCYGKPQTCTVCITQKNIWASRAGTPGFRPPEVLLKSKNQTQAVDIWGAGVIFLSILSGCSSFFSSPDDMTALAEIITLFGSEAIEKVASFYGYKLICSEYKCGMNIKNLCCALRSRGLVLNESLNNTACRKCNLSGSICLKGSDQSKIENVFPDSAYNLLKSLLNVKAKSRITAEDALKHFFFNELK